MKPCLSQTITLSSNFAEDVANYADAGCQALEVWLPKLEDHLGQHSVDVTHELLNQRGVQLVAAAYQGGLLLSHGDARTAHYDHFKRRLDICQQFRIPTLLVVADFIERVDQEVLNRAIEALAHSARWAAGFGVTLALEFRARNSFCSSLDTALALVEHCGEPNVGINLDVFHYYTGPSKFEDLALLSRERLAHVQLCDLSGVARELATDSDRVLPGDGDFQLRSIIDLLQKIGYDGHVSVELMNPTLWRANPKQVVEIAYTSLRQILGVA